MDADWEDVPVRRHNFFLRIGPVAMFILIILVLLVSVLFLSVVKIGGTQVGIVEKKLGGGTMPAGRVIAVNGENGIQAQVLAPFRICNANPKPRTFTHRKTRAIPPE